MAGVINIPKFVDFRNKVKSHPVWKFPMLSLESKITLIHHSLNSGGLAGSNAESYSQIHTDDRVLVIVTSLSQLARLCFVMTLS